MAFFLNLMAVTRGAEMLLHRAAVQDAARGNEYKPKFGLRTLNLEFKNFESS
jgi:hypothetical protein